jgi:hypothetical protein
MRLAEFSKKLLTVDFLLLFLDLIGLIFISWNLLPPEKIVFKFDSPYGVIADPKPFADAINAISRNFDNLYKMWFGFLLLVISQAIKLYRYFLK